MAVAPLSREALVEGSMFIYVGRVEHVRDEPAEPGEPIHQEAELALETVEKAILGDGEENPTVYYRLPGHTGDDSTYGQHAPLREGDRVRVYVTYDGQGRAQLLEPNGWEPA